MEDWPKLSPLPVEPEEDEVADDLKESTSARRKPSGPRVADPYTEEDRWATCTICCVYGNSLLHFVTPSSSMLPIFVAIGAFIPLVFCLCRL